MIQISAALLMCMGAMQANNIQWNGDMYTQNASYIPRDVIFSDPAYTGVRISPHGYYLSYIAPRNGVKNIYVAPIQRQDAAYAVTDDLYRGITTYVWAYDNRHILYLRDNDGDENWRVNAVDVIRGVSRVLTPGRDMHATIQHMTYKDPEHVVIAINDRRPDYHDLYKVNIATGAKTLIFQNDDYTDMTLDDQFNVRFAQASTSDGGTIIYRIEHQSPQRHKASPFKQVSPEEVFNTEIAAFDSDHNIVYLLDAHERDTNALYAYHLDTGEKTFIYAGAKADIQDVLFHPRKHTVQAINTYYLRAHWHVHEDTLQPTFNTLMPRDDTDMTIVSRDLDDTLWIVGYTRDVASPEYYILDRATHTLSYLFCAKPQLNAYNLSPMLPREIPARDGLTLPSYLTIPADQSKSHDGMPQRPLPLVLLVHGGPHARDSWGFHPIHQWLASRGYGVLSVNYRQSVGFGKHFAQAGFGEWSAKMQTDLLDAVDWAVNHGITTRDQVAIMGGSYGGYATLVGLTMTPDVFACGIDIVGPSNLVTLINSIPAYWKPKHAFFVRLTGGDPNTPEGRAVLEAKSPIHYVDNITKPLLIGQGANDPRVKQHESDQIVEAMQAKNIPVTYAVYPDEGHGFMKQQNKISFFAIAEQFLYAYLGGQYEPMHGELAHSSVKIQAGQVAA